MDTNLFVKEEIKRYVSGYGSCSVRSISYRFQIDESESIRLIGELVRDGFLKPKHNMFIKGVKLCPQN